MNIYFDLNDEFIVNLKQSLKDFNISDYTSCKGLQTGENNSFYGKKHTEESKKQISLKKKGVSCNKGSIRPWAKDNLKSIKNRAYGKFKIIEPDGKTLLVENLKQYCKNNNISYTSMSSLSNGNYYGESYKGYKIQKLGYVRIRQ